jgi:hypothetical protein
MNKKQFDMCQEELILTRKKLECQKYQLLTMREVKNTLPANNQLDTLRVRTQNIL